MGINKTSSVTYRDTASSFLAKRIGDYVAANNDRFQHLKNSLRSTTSKETKCHETSEKGFVPVHINYKTFDPKEGPDEGLVPIIFQHGALTSIENWGNMPQILADETKRKVYALDARNHGDSEWSEATDRETLAQDLIHFMNNNGITKCILIGHSMGGLSGLLAALMQKVTPARAPLSFSLLSNSALMSKSFSFDLLRLRVKTAWLWLPQSASLTVRCPQRYVHRDQRRI
ncbi:abhydrolase domain-containing protein 11 [Trichonephila clavipes]|nr:abhydrolase domain-containing protein 11 [Trichonephila clavipes]